MSALYEFFATQQEVLWLIVVLSDLTMTILLYRFFGKQGLYAAVVLDIMLCNIVGPKITRIFGIDTSMGAIIYAGIYFATDLLGEKYGRREANRAVALGFAVMVAVTVMGGVSLLFQPTPDPAKADFALKMHAAHEHIFGFAPRLALGSLVAYAVSQAHDVWAYHAIMKRTGRKHLWLRNNGSTIVSQAIDTILYSAIVWWGIFDFWTAVTLGLGKYFFKVVIALLDTPFIYLACRWDVSSRDWNEEAIEHIK
jgi:uncharacterized integral membrane protein (TIGR00697 family)